VNPDNAADGLRIRVDTGNGGTERMRVTADGRVGIATGNPTQRLQLGSGNVLLPGAQSGTDGNLYFGGRTDAQETGMRLFGGNVNNAIPGGFIDVRTTNNAEGLRIRVDTGNGGTERLRITPVGIQAFVPITQPSDARTKTNTRRLKGMLDKLVRIRGVAFDWAQSPQTLGGLSARSDIGVIAQEIEGVFPELVSDYGDQGYKAVNYSGLTATLIEAIKELKADDETLCARIEALERA
jgi:Chaperone of endosialidase